MRDTEAPLRVVVGGLIGTVAAIVLVSFALSAYGVAANGLNWNDLSSIASFWNGHLSSIALLVLALSLYYQSRQLATQAAAEQAQIARYRHELLRTSLSMLASRLEELGSGLRAYIVNSVSVPIEIRTFSGVQQFLAATAIDYSDRADPENEVWIDTITLSVYADALMQMDRLCKELLESDPAEKLPLIYRSLSSGTLGDYAAQLRAQQSHYVDKIRRECKDETVLAHLAEMLKQGWEVDDYRNSGRIFLKARRLAPTFGRIDTMGADDCPSMVDACKLLVQQWQNLYS